MKNRYHKPFEKVWFKNAEGRDYCDQAALWRNLEKLRHDTFNVVEIYKEFMDNNTIPIKEKK